MKRRLLLAGAILVVIVLAEVGARAFAPYLPEPELYADDTTTVKVAQLDALDCVDLVFAGNSMTRDGLDPRRFAEADPEQRRTYNAALDAATPALLERWVLDEVDPRVRPDGVVLGLTSFDLNDEASIGRSALEAYDAAPMTRDDFFGRLQRPFLENLTLFEHRNALRDPQEVWDGIGRARDGDREPRLDEEGIEGLIGPQGQGLSRQELTYFPSPALTRQVQSQLLNDFDLGGEQAEAAEALLRDLADRGIDTAVVVLPVTRDYIAAHPDGEDDFEEFLALAEQVAGDAGAQFIDLHDLITEDELFADMQHLNGRGADQLSRALPELLGPDFASGDRCA